MSNPPPSFDAYTPPEESGYVSPPPMSVTSGIKAICIIAIILGAMGTMAALFGAVSLAVGSKVQQMFTPPQIPGDNEETRRIQELQEEMQTQATELTRRYMPAFIVRLALHFPIAVGLLVGGIATLTGSLRGRKILRVACGVAIPFELGRAILDTIVQLENMAIMRPFMEQMLDTGVGNGGQGPPLEMMSSIFQVAYIAGLAFTLLLVLVKVIYYAISFVKLRVPAAEPGTPYS